MQTESGKQGLRSTQGPHLLKLDSQPPRACLGVIQLASAPWSNVSRKLLLPISGMTACFVSC